MRSPTTKQKQLAYNASGSPLLAQPGGMERYCSLSCSHTTQLLKAIALNCETNEEELQDKRGRLCLDSILSRMCAFHFIQVSCVVQLPFSCSCTQSNYQMCSYECPCTFHYHSRKLRERVLLKNSCSIDHQHDKTIADHQPLTTANDKTIADHQPLTTAHDKNDKTIADHQPLTTANDKTMRRSC